MLTIRSNKHEVYTERLNKKAISHVDNKRILCEDRIHTLAIGHWRTKNGGSSVSSGTT